jgi:hypothetical protein
MFCLNCCLLTVTEVTVGRGFDVVSYILNVRENHGTWTEERA